MECPLRREVDDVESSFPNTKLSRESTVRCAQGVSDTVYDSDLNVTHSVCEHLFSHTLNFASIVPSHDARVRLFRSFNFHIFCFARLKNTPVFPFLWKYNHFQVSLPEHSS